MNARAYVALAALAVILLASFFIRGQHLSAPFYYDEAVYVDLAQHPFHSAFYDDPIFFRHPPAHYLLLYGLGQVAGYSETAMRLPSLCFAVTTAFLIYSLGACLFSRMVGFIAALLLAFNVLNQQYAEAATMYAMLAFLLTLCCYGFVREREWPVAVGFLGAIYTHYFGFMLAPAVLLFYHRKFEGNWKKILGRIALYALAYAPWLVIAAQGVAFHANRTSGLRWWSFHWLHAIRQMSLVLFVGLLGFLFVRRRDRKLQPVLLVCGLYLLAAFFLIPFHRYLVPLLPVFILFGVAAIMQAIAHLAVRFDWKPQLGNAILMISGACALLLPNPQAYGLFPYTGAHVDLRDSIHAQEWDQVIAAIPDSAKVATPNARSLLFYSNLRGLRRYQVEQFNENKKEFAGLLESAKHDWIVLSKYPIYEALLEVADQNAAYTRVAEFAHTILYRKQLNQSPGMILK
ncbi:glycosyltransferase family 39 protein [candidate division KSB1 bacterium]|nr:glycosyltransferase family 39 protein [candidate division KSB1 bacterium]